MTYKTSARFLFLRPEPADEILDDSAMQDLIRLPHRSSSSNQTQSDSGNWPSGKCCWPSKDTSQQLTIASDRLYITKQEWDDVKTSRSQSQSFQYWSNNYNSMTVLLYWWIDGLNDWLADLLTYWLIWLTDWLTYRLGSQPTKTELDRNWSS